MGLSAFLPSGTLGGFVVLGALMLLALGVIGTLSARFKRD
jgi:hypothetical protein